MFFFILLTQYTCTDCVDSLKFRSAGKGPFMAGKAKNIHQRCTFLVEGRRDMARPYLEIQELSSLKCHSLILTPIFHKSAVVIFRQQLKTFDSKNFTVHTLVLFHKYIHSFPCENKIRSQFNFSKPSSSCKQ